MTNADIYRAVILRAVLGSRASAVKVDDLERLDRICAHLADCEEAQRILRRKGYGKPGMTFLETVCSVPDHARGIFRGILRTAGVKMPDDRSRMDEAFDIWTSR